MNTLQSVTTVGEVAARFPGSIRVFEKYGIDYCCGGGTPLDQVCRDRGLDPASVLAEAESAAPAARPEADWREATLDTLIAHIVDTHHAYLHAELPRLDVMLDKVTAAHAARHAQTLAALAHQYRTLWAELDAHLSKEELVLFPLIRAMEATGGAARGAAASHCGSVRNPIRVMEMEHDSAGEALVEMRAITSDYTPPEDACATFRALYAGLEEMEADLHRHIHLENNILFPRAALLEAR